MRILKTTKAGFQGEFRAVLERFEEIPPEVERTVRQIIRDVRRRGDRALLFYTRRFDRHSPRHFEVTAREIKKAYREVGRMELKSLKFAAKRIEHFHRLQARRFLGSWRIRDGGSLLGEQVLPLARVGLYVPGGLAAYPSTVLMNALPARVAGVRELIMTSPWTGGKIHPLTLVAADLVGVKRIFKVGGAQAIAALAYGTESIPAVDKIVGPGNLYVAAAKRLVFGRVGIDMIAGPTEVAIVADGSADPQRIAADLLSQAEHDPRAIPLLLTPSEPLAESVLESLYEQVKVFCRKRILESSLRNQAFVILTRDLKEAIRLANRIAPEHLEVQVKSPLRWLSEIRNAGAIFVGADSPVALGDYVAGPNHVLPTSGTARFSSPLGVGDFLKRSSVVEMTRDALKRLAPHAIRLARLEGLTAHAKSVEVRL